MIRCKHTVRQTDRHTHTHTHTHTRIIVGYFSAFNILYLVAQTGILLLISNPTKKNTRVSPCTCVCRALFVHCCVFVAQQAEVSGLRAQNQNQAHTHDEQQPQPGRGFFGDMVSESDGVLSLSPAQQEQQQQQTQQQQAQQQAQPLFSSFDVTLRSDGVQTNTHANTHGKTTAKIEREHKDRDRDREKDHKVNKEKTDKHKHSGSYSSDSDANKQTRSAQQLTLSLIVDPVEQTNTTNKQQANSLEFEPSPRSRTPQHTQPPRSLPSIKEGSRSPALSLPPLSTLSPRSQIPTAFVLTPRSLQRQNSDTNAQVALNAGFSPRSSLPRDVLLHSPSPRASVTNTLPQLQLPQRRTSSHTQNTASANGQNSGSGSGSANIETGSLSRSGRSPVKDSRDRERAHEEKEKTKHATLLVPEARHSSGHEEHEDHSSEHSLGMSLDSALAMVNG